MKKLEITIDHQKDQNFVVLDFYEEEISLQHVEDNGEFYLTFQEEEL